MAKISGHLVDPWANSKDFKNKNVNSDSFHSLRPVRYAPFPASHPPLSCTRTGVIPADPYTLEKDRNKSFSAWPYEQLLFGSFFLKVKSHESLDKSLNSRFFLKIFIIHTWVKQLTWKFGHNSALSGALQQGITLDPTLTSSRNNGGSRIYLSCHPVHPDPDVRIGKKNSTLYILPNRFDPLTPKWP